jgi:hypothetical protein
MYLDDSIRGAPINADRAGTNVPPVARTPIGGPF